MLGVIGGSGFYSLLAHPEERQATTPYGDPSAPPTLGTIGGSEVVFLPRHGETHRIPPHLVPYRANIHALRDLGVDRLVTANAVGSIRRDMAPGHFVVPDQIVDRTWGRPSTFYDGPDVHHLAFADPFHDGMRRAALDGLRSAGATAHDGATMVVVQGPRFSTRAESAAFSASGWDLLNMTAMPEVALAREAGMCVATIAVVTDYDVGLDGAPPVTHEAVLAQFEQAIGTLEDAITAMAGPIGAMDLTCDGEVA
jgi:5'-methylthioadenosine phosphorylase